MRVNVYAEEMTDRIEIIGKEIDGHTFTGLRFYLELPATVNGEQHQGPFIHRPGDDDSSAVTFWGKRDLRVVLTQAQEALDRHYGEPKLTEYHLRYLLLQKVASMVEAFAERECAPFRKDEAKQEIKDAILKLGKDEQQ